MPVTAEKYFNLIQYVALFKEYAEALQLNDFETIARIVENSFRQKLYTRLDEAHEVLKDNDMKIEMQNFKRSDNTDFFLYNVDNYLLCGAGIDRTRNGPKHHYMITEDEEFSISNLNQEGPGK